MRRLRDRSIRQKLTMIVMVPSLIALLLASVVFITYDFVSFRQSMVDARTGDAEMIGTNCIAAVTFDDAEHAEEMLSALRIHSQIVAAFIYTPDGEIFARYTRPETTGDFIPYTPRGAGAYFEEGYLFVFQPIVLQGETLGTISIQSDLSEVRSRINRYLVAGVPVLALCFVVALLLQARLSRVITRPIAHLARTARTVSEQKDYSVRAEKEGEDELGGLVDGFNEMLAQIQQQDEALREGEARFRDVLDNTQDLLYKLNLVTMEYEYFSPAAVPVTGFTPEELRELGAGGIRSRIHPDDQGKARANFGSVTVSDEHDRSSRADYRWMNKEGVYTWATDTRTVVRDDEGRAIAVVGSFRDVTERKRAEEEIIHMRRHLQNIIDSMPSVLIGVDSRGMVTLWNAEAARVSGSGTEDVEGRRFSEAFPLLAVMDEKIQEAIDLQTPLFTDRFSSGESGEETVYYDLIVYALSDSGVPGAVIRVDDVTARVKIEEMMVQTEKMMSVGGLAAGMAHEINNPLGGILQACQNITRRTSPDLPKNREVAEKLGIDIELVHRYAQERGISEFIEGIQSDGKRAAKIVADMLAFSRKSNSRFEPVKVEEMVDTVLRLAANDYDLKKHYDFRSIEINKEFDADLPEVRCDKTKIEQVLLNLVKNAAQAMGANENQKDPMLTIRTCKEPEYARIEVIDNGPGMEEEVRRRVLEPFFTTKEAGIGTGLGLSVSYFIISKHHKGKMNVESTVGEGTRFIIHLPLNGQGQ